MEPQPPAYPGGDVCLYDVLQVSPQAIPEVIQAAYRVLARTYHPDISQAVDAEERTRRLNAAHYILSDPARRALYDASRASAARVRATSNRTQGTARTARTQLPRGSQSNYGYQSGAPSPILVWVLTAVIAILMVCALLVILWSLFDAFDSHRGPAIRSFDGRPALSSFSSPFTAKTNGPSR